MTVLLLLYEQNITLQDKRCSAIKFQFTVLGTPNLGQENSTKGDGFVVWGRVCLEEGLTVFNAPAILSPQPR